MQNGIVYVVDGIHSCSYLFLFLMVKAIKWSIASPFLKGVSKSVSELKNRQFFIFSIGGKPNSIATFTKRIGY
jgi:hypothetical protein